MTSGNDEPNLLYDMMSMRGEPLWSYTLRWRLSAKGTYVHSLARCTFRLASSDGVGAPERGVTRTGAGAGGKVAGDEAVAMAPRTNVTICVTAVPRVREMCQQITAGIQQRG